jgi:hypothetical protein
MNVILHKNIHIKYYNRKIASEVQIQSLPFVSNYILKQAVFMVGNYILIWKGK